MVFLNKEALTSVGHQDLVSLGLAGAIKPYEEIFLAPYIGNGTVKSGAIKLIAGIAAHYFGANKVPYVGPALVAALVVDGGEDILRGVMSGNVMGTSNGNSFWGE
jgi:hypothetical protein